MAVITPALIAHRLAKRQRLMIKAKRRKEAAPRRLSEAERLALSRMWANYSDMEVSVPIPRHSI